MGQTHTSTMSADLVLVSGTSGFLGTAVTLAYLEKGYRVRGTVRSQEKADKWAKKHEGKFDKSKLEWAIVKDVAAPGAFDEAIKGVTILAHTASPFHYDVKDNEKDLLIPALEGTRHAHRAAQKEPSVKRVVVTSSFAAVMDFNRLSPETTFTHEDWNPATYDEAKKSDNQTFVYCASKKVAETSFPVGTDSRDIANLHVLATTTDEGADKRFLAIAFHFDNSQVVDVARKAFPELDGRLPKAEPSEGKPHFKTDSSLVDRTFGGFKWISFEDSTKDTLAEILRVEKALKQ